MPRLTHYIDPLDIDAVEYCRSRMAYHLEMLRRWQEAEHAAVDCNEGVTLPEIAAMAIRQAEKAEVSNV